MKSKIVLLGLVIFYLVATVMSLYRYLTTELNPEDRTESLYVTCFLLLISILLVFLRYIKPITEDNISKRIENQLLSLSEVIKLDVNTYQLNVPNHEIVLIHKIDLASEILILIPFIENHIDQRTKKRFYNGQVYLEFKYQLYFNKLTTEKLLKFIQQKIRSS